MTYWPNGRPRDASRKEHIGSAWVLLANTWTPVGSVGDLFAAAIVQSNGSVYSSVACSVTENGTGDYTVTLEDQTRAWISVLPVVVSGSPRIIECSPTASGDFLVSYNIKTYDHSGVAAAGIFFFGAFATAAEAPVVP